eukprot:9483832-Ditylum_brightwellii.AAC.1
MDSTAASKVGCSFKLQKGGEEKKDGEDRVEREATYVATLSKCPCDLHVLWNKYEFGTGGRKAAKDFSSSEKSK